MKDLLFPDPSSKIDIPNDGIAGIAVHFDLIFSSVDILKFHFVDIDRIKDAADIAQMAVGVIHIIAFGLFFTDLFHQAGIGGFHRLLF